ncbi:MAG: hypothetical protein ACI3Z9_01935 [Candidatus Onthomorpha sp.]
MDFIKKNCAWIALAGLAISVYVYYKTCYNSNSSDNGSAGFAGKVAQRNPITL